MFLFNGFLIPIHSFFYYRSVIPKKKPRGGHLSIPDRDRNNRISSDRVIVEIFFGQLQQLFGVMHRKYGWCREKLDAIIDICMSLTNYHIRLHPLREEDRQFHLRVLSALRARSEEIANAGCTCQLCHCRRQQQMERALEEDLEPAFGDDHGMHMDIDCGSGGRDNHIVTSSGGDNHDDTPPIAGGSNAINDHSDGDTVDGETVDGEPYIATTRNILEGVAVATNAQLLESSSDDSSDDELFGMPSLRRPTKSSQSKSSPPSSPSTTNNQQR